MLCTVWWFGGRVFLKRELVYRRRGVYQRDGGPVGEEALAVAAGRVDAAEGLACATGCDTVLCVCMYKYLTLSLSFCLGGGAGGW